MNKIVSSNQIKIDVHHLRDIEQSILSYMLMSSTNFIKIKNKLSKNDFTFLIHKRMFKGLTFIGNMFFSQEHDEDIDFNAKLDVFSRIMHEKENIKIASTLDILSQAPSIDIERDLEIINAYSMEKEIASLSEGIVNSATIETKYGKTWLNFNDGRLISVGTTNIAKLPTEVYDNFSDMLKVLTQLDLQNGENKASMIFFGDPENPDGVESFYLKKDLLELKWFDDICLWADKYDLDEDTFPRDRYKLQDLLELDISDKGITELPKEIGKLSNLKILLLDNNNIKEFPNELYQLRNLILLSFIKNKISYISEEVINLQKLLMFAACHNEVELVPNNFFRLKNLTNFCLHGNRLTTLSNDLGNLSNLTSISISNNDIALLPQSISKLEHLESLDMENTQISEIPMDFLKHGSLNNLSISDSLLPFIVKNLQYLNVDTINLSASEFQESSQIIQELGFKLDTKTWMEDIDKKENGCVLLLKD